LAEGVQSTTKHSRLAEKTAIEQENNTGIMKNQFLGMLLVQARTDPFCPHARSLLILPAQFSPAGSM
jgi:hypothetical protein